MKTGRRGRADGRTVCGLRDGAMVGDLGHDHVALIRLDQWT